MGKRGINFWKQWLPTPLRRWWRKRYGWRLFVGDFAAWSDACAVAAGYSAPEKTAQIVAAARAVRAGRASWDRDGILFHEPVLHEPLLKACRQVAEANGGRLAVIDFGGGLGSTWWQHRQALAGYRVTWRIVERPTLVAIGQNEFCDAELSFYPSLVEADGEKAGQIILLSSVLPYVDDPHALLKEVIAHAAPHVIVDRMPFIMGGRDRLVVQCAPPGAGGGRYPCWLFNREGIAAHFLESYNLIAEWPVSFDRGDENVACCGLHFQRRPSDSLGRALVSV